MKEYIFAQPFIAWLEERVGEQAIHRATKWDEAFARRRNSWNNSPSTARTSIYTVDELLVRCFPSVDLWEIPESFYCDYRQPRSYPEKTRKMALSLVEMGWTPSEISKEIGCSIDAIHLWKQREKVPA